VKDKRLLRQQSEKIEAMEGKRRFDPAKAFNHTMKENDASVCSASVMAPLRESIIGMSSLNCLATNYRTRVFANADLRCFAFYLTSHLSSNSACQLRPYTSATVLTDGNKQTVCFSPVIPNDWLCFNLDERQQRFGCLRAG
jgi:hypothetical protein